MSADIIAFGVWAPDEATFRQSWIDAGILADEPGYVFTPGYPGVELTTTQGWSGVIVLTPDIRDADGNVVTPAVIVPGWHCNVRVTGSLVAEMTHGLNQTDENGVLLSVFDRTWAPQIFGLTAQAADGATGLPAGYRNTAGVTYVDMRDISTPSNVRQ